MFSDRKLDDDDEAGPGGLHADQLPVVEGATHHHVLRTKRRSLKNSYFKASLIGGAIASG